MSHAPTTTAPQFDPSEWPLAPGNAPAHIEAALQAEAARWPEPTVELRDRVTAILRSVDRSQVSA